MRVLSVLRVAVMLGSLLIFCPQICVASGDNKVAEAQQAIAQKKYREARALYLQLAQQSPENLDYWLWVARLSAWLHDFKAAQTYYNQILRKHPDNMDAWLGRAYVFMWQGKLKGAREMLKHAQFARGSKAAWHIAMVNFYCTYKQPKSAKKYINDLIKLDPKNAEIAGLQTRIKQLRRVHIQFGSELQETPYAPLVNTNYFGVTIDQHWGKIGVRAEAAQSSGKVFKRVGVDVARKISMNTWIMGQAFYFGTDKIGQQSQLGVGFITTLSPRLTVGVDLNKLRLTNTTSVILNPRVSFQLMGKMRIQLDFYRNWERETSNRGQTNTKSSFAIKIERSFKEFLVVRGGYTSLLQQNFNEHLLRTNVDRRQNIILSGILRITSHVSLQSSYIYTFTPINRNRHYFGVGVMIH